METQHKLKIGVMGSASGPHTKDERVRERARQLGREIGRRGYIFINGACPGLPNDALLGAQEEGGFSVGISPAFSRHQHVNEYQSPLTHDMVLYTGMGFMERDVINIRSTDAIVIIGGGIGTLNEFTIAYDEGRPIGVLTDTGGISNSIEHIVVQLCSREMPPNLVMDSDPVKLMDKLEMAIKVFPIPIQEDDRTRRLKKGRG